MKVVRHLFKLERGNRVCVGVKKMSKSTAFKAACLGASLATAWTAAKADGATDYQLTATGNLSVSLSHLTLISGDLTVPIPDDSDGVSTLRTISGTNFSGTLTLNSVADDLASRPWELIGLGTGDQSNDVVVLMSDPSSALGRSFLDAFNSDEAALVSSITKRQSADVSKFALSLGDAGQQAFGSASTAVEFSNGVNVGSITLSLTAVPEPSGLALLATGIAAMFRRVRRKR
jgi:hypothetical protein